jgi:YHS domain-containing protein
MLKWSALLAVACVFLVTGAIALNAAAEKPPAEKPATQPATTQPAPVNKLCPITREDVDPKGKTVTYKGKTIGFCCEECIEKFNKNPEKYMKNLK